MVLFYGYAKCATCRNAKAYLIRKGITFRDMDITTTAPSKTILQSILASNTYQVKDLFNRSGQLYRAMKIKDRWPTMSVSQALALLSTHGRLVKRPIVTDGTRHTVGFDEARFKQVWGS